MGKPDLHELLTEDEHAAYKRMRREVAEALDAADDTVHRASIRVINLPDGRPAEESALAHEISIVLTQLRDAYSNLLGMSAIRQGGLQRKTRVGNGSIEISMTVSDEVMEYLVDKSFHADFGARPLKRAIERSIEDPLSEEILQGMLDGHYQIFATMDGEEIRFDRKALPKPEPEAQTLPEQVVEATADADGSDQPDAELPSGDSE